MSLLNCAILRPFGRRGVVHHVGHSLHPLLAGGIAITAGPAGTAAGRALAAALSPVARAASGPWSAESTRSAVLLTGCGPCLPPLFEICDPLIEVGFSLIGWKGTIGGGFPLHLPHHPLPAGLPHLLPLLLGELLHSPPASAETAAAWGGRSFATASARSPSLSDRLGSEAKTPRPQEQSTGK